MTTYLDWNATTSLHPLVAQALHEAEGDFWANPSSVHTEGRRARRAVEDVREQLAGILRVSARDVIFTSGGTEANHLALCGARELVTSALEHPSISQQAQYLKEMGTRVEFAAVSPDGVVTAEAVEDALERLLKTPRPALDTAQGGINNKNTPLVTLMAANHETGVIQPLGEVAEVVRRWGARLHVDAVQVLGRARLEVLEVADSLSVCAHKIRGPKGIGALAFGCGWSPLPDRRGGAQERGLRAGTVDARAIFGFGAALQRLEESRAAYEQAGGLARRLEAQLCQISGARIQGASVSRLSHVVNFRVPGWKGDELVAALDMQGVCVSSGSACSAGTAEPSAVITAMLGAEAAAGAVRVSFGEESRQQDLTALLRALSRVGVLRSPDNTEHL